MKIKIKTFNVTVSFLIVFLVGLVSYDYRGIQYGSQQQTLAENHILQVKFEKEMQDFDDMLAQNVLDLDDFRELKKQWDTTTERLEEIQAEIATRVANEQEKLDLMAQQFVKCVDDIGSLDTCEQIIREIHNVEDY